MIGLTLTIILPTFDDEPSLSLTMYVITLVPLKFDEGLNVTFPFKSTDQLPSVLEIELEFLG